MEKEYIILSTISLMLTGVVSFKDLIGTIKYKILYYIKL